MMWRKCCDSHSGGCQATHDKCSKEGEQRPEGGESKGAAKGDVSCAGGAVRKPGRAEEATPTGARETPVSRPYCTVILRTLRAHLVAVLLRPRAQPKRKRGAPVRRF